MALERYLRFVHHTCDQELFCSKPCNCESWNKLTVVAFPDRCNIKLPRASMKHVWSLHLGTWNSYLRCTLRTAPPECSSLLALAVTDFWYLHGQLQAFAGLMARFEEAAVHITGQVAVTAWMVLIWGRGVPVRGAAQVDAHCLTCVREHEEAVQELAEETGED